MYKFQVEEKGTAKNYKKRFVIRQNYVIVIAQFAYHRSSKDIYLAYLTFYIRNMHLKSFKSTPTRKRLSKELRRILLLNMLYAFHGSILILIARTRSKTLGRSKRIHKRMCMQKNEEVPQCLDRPIKDTLTEPETGGPIYLVLSRVLYTPSRDFLCTNDGICET